MFIANGYFGQTIEFIGNGYIAYVSGIGLCIHHLQNSTTEMIWRPNAGINTFKYHNTTNKLALAYDVAGASVEITQYPDHDILFAELKNTTSDIVKDLAFSHDGSRLVAISDFFDHKCIVWSIDSKETLLTVDLEFPCEACVVNPLNMNLISFVSSDGVHLGEIKEVYADYSIQTRKTIIGPDCDMIAAKLDNKIDLDVRHVLFFCWAPEQSAFIGLASGAILCADMKQNESIFYFLIDEIDSSSNRIVKRYPESAVLSADYLIIADSCGALSWYSTVELDVSNVHENVLRRIYVSPKQVFNLVEEIPSHMSIDPSYNTIVVGTKGGNVYNVPISIQCLEPDVDTDGDDEGELSANEHCYMRSIQIQNVKPLLSMDSSVILCSKSFDVVSRWLDGSKKFTENCISMFVTGSHIGEISFWKFLAPSSNEIGYTSESNHAAGTFPPHVMPESLTLLHRQLLRSNGSDSTAPVSALEVLIDAVRPNKFLVTTGNICGLVNIWMVEVLVHEDKIGGDHGSNEELNATKLKISLIYNDFLFSCAVTNLSYSYSFDYMAISSHRDSKVFVIERVLEMDIDVLGFVDTLGVCNSQIPTEVVSCAWIENSLVIFFINGAVAMKESICSGLSSKNLNSVCAWNGSLGSLCGLTGEINVTTSILSDNFFICFDDNAKKARKFYINTKTNEVNAILSTHAASASYDDVMISSGISPACNICVSGGMFGNVYIWNFTDWTIISMMRLHSKLVLTVSVSSDGSSLYSSSADGSKYISSMKNIHAFDSVDVPSRREIAFENITLKGVEEICEDNFANQISHQTDLSNSWIEKHNRSILTRMKEASFSKISDCKAALSVISGRLNTLLKINLDCDEIEKLSRTEFVVDVVAKDKLTKNNEKMSGDLIQSHIKINAYNECVAARIKHLCWDTTEVHSCGLCPLEEGVLNTSTDKSIVYNFPIQLYSDWHKKRLKRVKRLRSLEIRSQFKLLKNSYQQLADGVTNCSWMKISTENCTWISGDALLRPTFDVLEKLNQSYSENMAANVSNSGLWPVQSGFRIDAEGVMDGSVQHTSKFSIDESSCLHLIYSPLTVRTEVQRRFQIMFVQDVLHSIKSGFNRHFLKLYSMKEECIASINSKNARIREILEELQETEEVNDVLLVDMEIAEFSITVHDKDLRSRLYENATEEAMRLAEAEEKRKKEASSADGDVKGRALDEMMHGTLETKRDLFAEVSAIQKPEWMIETEPSDMTEAQLIEYEEYQDRLKILQDEQIKYSKSLEFEMKRLKLEIIELATNFNAKLAKISDERNYVLRLILTQELNLARSSLHVTTQDFITTSLSLKKENIEFITKKSREIKEKLVKVSKRTDALRSQISLLQDEGRMMDKTFRRDLQVLCDQNYDQDSLRTFTDLYKARTYNDKIQDDSSGNDYTDEKSECTSSIDNICKLSSKKFTKTGIKDSLKKQSKTKNGNIEASEAGMDSHSDVDALLGPLKEVAAKVDVRDMYTNRNLRQDPFYRCRMSSEREKRFVENQIPLLISQSIETECPDGFNVDQYAWSKLQELRSARIQKEIDEKLMLLRLSDVNQRIEEIQASMKRFDSSLLDLRNSIEHLKHERKQMGNDVQITVSLKQGQDEVDRDSFVTRYAQSILLPSDIIDKYNALISQLGTEKIGVLFRVKSFRRKINIIDWEANHTQLEAWHLDEYFTDLQLMRVTRDFQWVIRAESNTGNRHRTDKISLRKDYIHTDTDCKLNGISILIERLRTDIDKKASENASLVKNIHGVKRDVEVRNSIKHSRDSAKGETINLKNLAMKRMQKVVARSQIADATKMRVEQLDVLRQDLDKIRQKTFPSFVKAARQRTFANPDEKSA